MMSHTDPAWSLESMAKPRRRPRARPGGRPPSWVGLAMVGAALGVLVLGLLWALFTVVENSQEQHRLDQVAQRELLSRVDRLQERLDTTRAEQAQQAAVAEQQRAILQGALEQAGIRVPEVPTVPRSSGGTSTGGTSTTSPPSGGSGGPQGSPGPAGAPGATGSPGAPGEPAPAPGCTVENPLPLGPRCAVP